LESYREKQKRQQVAFLKMEQDDARLVVRPPRFWLGFLLGVLMAVAVFIAGTLPDAVGKRRGDVRDLAAQSPDSATSHEFNIGTIGRPEPDYSKLKPAAVGCATVLAGFLTFYVTSRLFRSRILLDRRTNQIIVGSRVLDLLSAIDHVGWAKYKTVASRVPVTQYQVALVFRDAVHKPLAICEFNSSDPIFIANTVADFVGAPIRHYDAPIA